MGAGAQPFIGPTPKWVIAQRISFKPTPVAQFRGSVAAELEAIFERAMMLDPPDRFQTAGEMLTALQLCATEPSNPGAAC